MLLLVFLICLYINYSLGLPTYEGFDSVGMISNVLGGLFVVGIIILMIYVSVVTVAKKNMNINREG